MNNHSDNNPMVLPYADDEAIAERPEPEFNSDDYYREKYPGDYRDASTVDESLNTALMAIALSQQIGRIEDITKSLSDNLMCKRQA